MVYYLSTFYTQMAEFASHHPIFFSSYNQRKYQTCNQEELRLILQQSRHVTMILLKVFKESQGEAGIVQKVLNYFSYKHIRQGSFFIPCFSFNKNFISLSSAKNLNKPCTGLQTFLYIIFATLNKEFLGFLKIPVSRSFSFYAIC